ncbi:MAG: molybdopterin converting factor subunit 1 [Pseudomonadota bacterium]
MKLVYFASLRERLGTGGETRDIPADVATVGDLMTWLKGQDEAYAAAFEDGAKVRAAVDQVHAKPETLLANAREVAFFPPVTGG